MLSNLGYFLHKRSLRTPSLRACALAGLSSTQWKTKKIDFLATRLNRPYRRSTSPCPISPSINICPFTEIEISAVSLIAPPPLPPRPPVRKQQITLHHIYKLYNNLVKEQCLTEGTIICQNNYMDGSRSAKIKQKRGLSQGPRGRGNPFLQKPHNYK